VLGDLLHDLRHAARGLLRRPGFTLLVVLTLALGIGANAAIFSLVNAVILRALPVRDPEALILFAKGAPSGRMLGLPLDDGGRLQLSSYPLYQQLRDAGLPIELAVQDSNAEASIVVGRGSQPEPGDRADGRCVSAGYFSLLGVSAQLGRVFGPGDETAPGSDHVVVLSDGFWRRRFGGDRQIVGAPLTINGTSYTVAGVTRPDFAGIDGGSATDFWVPVTMGDELTHFGLEVRRPDYWWLTLVGRLRPGATAAAVETGAQNVLRQFLATHPEVSPDPRVRERARIVVEPGARGFSRLRQAYREPLLVLMAAVALLLLIVSLNVAHLLLARAVGRRQEMSVRAALGASRMRLVRQLLAEALLLAGLGAAIAVVIEHWLVDGLVALVAPQRSELVLDTSTDGRVVLFVAAVALGTALILGLLPALEVAGAALAPAIRGGSPTVTAGGPRHLASRALLVSQVAVSLVLLVGAGLLAGTLGRLRGVASGFDEEHVLLAEVNVQKAGLDDQQALNLYREVERQVSALPGVRAVSLSVPGPLGDGTLGWGISFPGSKREPRGMQFALVTPGYFEAVGLRLLRGRVFTHGDGPGAPRVAVVNEAMARGALGGAEAVGQRISLDGQHDVEVVGVVSDAHGNGLREREPPLFYLAAAQPHGTPAVLRLASLQVRGEGDPAQLADAVRAAVRAADARLPLTNLRSLGTQVDRTLRGERLLAVLSSAFGLTALFLVAIGLYGVIAQWAALRTREIGVRMALGATSGGVRWLVLRQAFALVMVGLLVGIPAALASSRLLEGMLFGVRPMHAPTVAGAGLLMLAVAALAAYLPAWRASRVDPMKALRYE
jgi:predicted permease